MTDYLTKELPTKADQMAYINKHLGEVLNARENLRKSIEDIEGKIAEKSTTFSAKDLTALTNLETKLNVAQKNLEKVQEKLDELLAEHSASIIENYNEGLDRICTAFKQIGLDYETITDEIEDEYNKKIQKLVDERDRKVNAINSDYNNKLDNEEQRFLEYEKYLTDVIGELPEKYIDWNFLAISSGLRF